MSVSTTGSIFLEPLPGFSQPTPLATFIGVAASAGDGSGGTNTTTYTLSQDLLWVPRVFMWTQGAAAAVVVRLNIDQLAFGQNYHHCVSAPSDGARAAITFEIPRWLVRPDGQDVRAIFSSANVNAQTATTTMRWYGFPKTVLRDFSASELLGFVL